MAGRLSFFLPKWREITSNPVILEAISGYRLPFRDYPPLQDTEPSLFQSKSEEVICHQEISRLIDKRAIEPVLDCKGQFLSSFFVIRKSSGGWRFILNLKRLNEFIIAPHFKMEDWKTVIHLLSPGDFLASIDLEDVYFFLLIHQEDRKFLRFRFQGRLFQFRALPFGLASEPYIFTKILKPILYSLREKGFLSVAYLDDFLLIGSSYGQCLKNISTTLNLFSSLGFMVNRHKSMLTPARSARYLGFIFDTEDFSMSIPPNKRNKLLQKTLSILSKESCKIRCFASFIGSLISVCPVVQYGILHTKILEREKFFALLAANDNFEARMTSSFD